jgi:nucleoside-diphosphate-sugar epimerase
MNQKILVAGATGNLGERIVKALIKRGAEVRVLNPIQFSLDIKRWFSRVGTAHQSEWWAVPTLQNLLI